MTLMEICCKDNVALEAEYDRELHVFTSIVRVVDGRFIPPGALNGSGQASKAGLSEWWRQRAIPVTRDGFQTLKGDLFGIDRLDLLDDSHGLSLSDQFWMREKGSGIEWEGVNFFDNEFDETLGLLTLGSFDAAVRALERGSVHGPNSSLVGNLRKAWERREEGVVLVKAGSAPLEQEPVNELIATRLYERLLGPGEFVPYRLERKGGRLYSVCPDMVDRDECLVPARDIIHSFKMPGHLSMWQHLNACYSKLGIADSELALSKMFVCDYIIANHDRHWNNLGVVFDADTMSAKRVAPIFDSGSSLWCDAFDLEESGDYRYRPQPLIRERSRAVLPVDQLEMVDCSSWIDTAALEGFPEEVEAILRSESRLSPRRVDAVAAGVRANIARLEAVARRQRAARRDRQDGFSAACARATASAAILEAEREREGHGRGIER